MYYIVYLSASVRLFTNSELMLLLEKSRINNSRAGITGMMMYNQGTFFQSIEGEEAQVKEMYKKISADPRHHNIIKLKSGFIAERNFPGWALAFTSSLTNDDSPLTDFVNQGDNFFNSNGHDVNPVVNLLQSFAVNNDLQYRPM